MLWLTARLPKLADGPGEDDDTQGEPTVLGKDSPQGASRKHV
jgi:hypothetical protein